MIDPCTVFDISWLQNAHTHTHTHTHTFNSYSQENPGIAGSPMILIQGAFEARSFYMPDALPVAQPEV